MLVVVVVATVAEEGEEEGEEGDSSTCPLGANATRRHTTSKSSSEAAAAAAPPPPSPPASEGIPPCLDLCGWRHDQKPPPVPSNITGEEARAVIRRCCS